MQILVGYTLRTVIVTAHKNIAQHLFYSKHDLFIACNQLCLDIHFLTRLLDKFSITCMGLKSWATIKQKHRNNKLQVKTRMMLVLGRSPEEGMYLNLDFVNTNILSFI